MNWIFVATFSILKSGTNRRLWDRTLSEILQDLQLRFGPQQQPAANIGRVVPAFMDFDDADSSDVETFGRQVLMSNLPPYQDNSTISVRFGLWYAHALHHTKNLWFIDTSFHTSSSFFRS